MSRFFHFPWRAVAGNIAIAWQRAPIFTSSFALKRRDGYRGQFFFCIRSRTRDICILNGHTLHTCNACECVFFHVVVDLCMWISMLFWRVVSILCVLCKHDSIQHLFISPIHACMCDLVFFYEPKNVLVFVCIVSIDKYEWLLF